MNPLIKTTTVLLVLYTAASLHTVSPAQPRPVPHKSIEQRIDSLMALMSLDDKIGQTAQRGASSRVKGPLPDALKKAVRQGRTGSVINVVDVDKVNELQRMAVMESPRHIPILFARDVIHGYKTIFPIPLGQAATWDAGIVETGARIAAAEASANGIRWTFAPMLDICRDARWGRIAESAGEDPYLSAVLAKAYIQGFQGNDLSAPGSIAACAKHFAAYGAAEGGRDYNTTNIPEPLLRNIYLPPFLAAKEAGAATFMAAFNDINGIPATGHQWLLTTLLRKEWQYDGMVVSDWNGVSEMIVHGFCADSADAARKAINAGVDMEMTSTTYERNLKTLIAEKKVSLAQLDKLVRNVLRLKFRLGLFDRPYTPAPSGGEMRTAASLEAAKQAAIASAVLLKNDNHVLPFSANIHTIAVTGPLADAPHDQLGTWTFDGDSSTTQTPLAAMRQRWGSSNILYAPGMGYSRQQSTAGFADALAAARKADAVVFFGGEEAILSGEAHSRADLSLPGLQESLIAELKKEGKPLVLVIMAGRPITLPHILDKTDAVIMAWHPGTMGGPALAEILAGVQAPEGRLPVTWPKTAGQEPLYYNHTSTGRPATAQAYVPIDSIPVGAWQSSLGNTSHYLDAGYLPQYPFGYGLSYTTFAYDHLQVSQPAIRAGDTLQLTAAITNTGSLAGAEVVQLYVQQLTGSIVRPVKELKRFIKIRLAPGTTQTVRFTLSTNDLAYHPEGRNKVLEKGKYKVWIGSNAAEGPEGNFEIR